MQVVEGDSKRSWSVNLLQNGRKKKESPSPASTDEGYEIEARVNMIGFNTCVDRVRF